MFKIGSTLALILLGTTALAEVNEDVGGILLVPKRFTERLSDEQDSVPVRVVKTELVLGPTLSCYVEWPRGLLLQNQWKFVDVYLGARLRRVSRRGSPYASKRSDKR